MNESIHFEATDMLTPVDEYRIGIFLHLDLEEGYASLILQKQTVLPNEM
jgi:hypothetical protein